MPAPVLMLAAVTTEDLAAGHRVFLTEYNSDAVLRVRHSTI